MTRCVVIDLEYPHLGFVQIRDPDPVLANLAQGMNWHPEFLVKRPCDPPARGSSTIADRPA